MMKKQQLMEVKKLEIPALLERVKKIRGELSDLVLDKNMDKLKDVRMIHKTRRDLAQVLTILRQKQLVSELESRVQSPESSEEVNSQEVKNDQALKQRKGGNSRAGSKSTGTENRFSRSAKTV